MIIVEVEADAAILRLGRIAARTREAVAGEVATLTQQLVSLIRQKLSGPVLSQRSGRLHDSIVGRVGQGVDTIESSVSWQDVPYAAVHEFGGNSAYPIVPTNARALAFMIGGTRVFARSVNHPPAKERSFMRSSLDEMRDQIVASLTAAARAAVEAV
jgi:phage gpG-like protein